MAISVPTPSPVVFNPGEPLDVDKLNLVQDNIQKLTSTVGLVNNSIDGYTTKITANNIRKKIVVGLNHWDVPITSLNPENVFVQLYYPDGATAKTQMSSYYELVGQTLTIYVISNQAFNEVRINYMYTEKVSQ